MPKPQPDPSPQNRSALSQALEHFGAKPVRRSDLEERLLGLTSPQSRQHADALAALLIHEAAAQGRIRREGHQHWVAAARGRTLLDGTLVPKLGELVQLNLETRCPQKWLAIDLETCEIWQPTSKGWRHATQANKKLAAKIAGE
ncbi:hypothetical protein [Hydrogenophaga sp. BPS33]|uniref:hypothetical protein n=1 Tax=Hydrogenophaga sp. BPS33 TaxID=2651974 RepID=UPI001320025E|nr:hypothetical protein [Hydrogenophaga sp. BPS33]QHE89229.1 hypothetical protein F9K07_30045 [Hydrogenophaga sp. BPS33]